MRKKSHGHNAWNWAPEPFLYQTLVKYTSRACSCYRKAQSCLFWTGIKEFVKPHPWLHVVHRGVMIQSNRSTMSCSLQFQNMELEFWPWKHTSEKITHPLQLQPKQLWVGGYLASWLELADPCRRALSEDQPVHLIFDLLRRLWPQGVLLTLFL